jgi:hypothetical protein
MKATVSALTVLLLLGTIRADNAGPEKDKAKIARARIDIENLTKAVEIYYVKEAVFPESLEVLTKAMAIVKKDSLIDPWGNAYQYDVSGTKNCGRVPDIWTVTPGKVIIGNWPPEKKKKKQ